MKVTDIAFSIYIDNGSPTYTSIPAIAYYIRNKIGALNSLICEDFKIDCNTLEIISCNGSEICIDAVEILKQMYRIYYLQVQVNNLMNALASDSLLSAKDNFGGGEFQRVNKNSMAQTLITIRKDEIGMFNKLVGAYKINRGTAAQIVGDDCIAAPFWNESLISLRNV